MGTKSRIAVEVEDGTFKSVSCHWDGGLDYNGLLLLRYYTDLKVANELMNMGDISSLAESIGHKHPFMEETKMGFLDRVQESVWQNDDILWT